MFALTLGGLVELALDATSTTVGRKNTPVVGRSMMSREILTGGELLQMMLQAHFLREMKGGICRKLLQTYVSNAVRIDSACSSLPQGV